MRRIKFADGALEFVIPYAGSLEQQLTIQDAVRYGAEHGVRVDVIGARSPCGFVSLIVAAESRGDIRLFLFCHKLPALHGPFTERRLSRYTRLIFAKQQLPLHR